MSPVPDQAARAPQESELSLGDLLDRLVGRGVALQGEVVLSVAGVDLIWLGLNAVLAGADLAPPGAGVDLAGRTVGAGLPGYSEGTVPARLPRPTTQQPPPRETGAEGDSQHRRSPANRLAVEDDRVEEGLVRLVLSVVELLRQLMEGQAIRRMEAGALADEQLERLGAGLERLSERMEELKEFFGLSGDDLELRLAGVQDIG